MTEKMKPSGIAWIGDIPASWKTKKIKHYTKIVNGSTPDSSDFNCWDGPIKWITPADMDNTGIISEGERTLTQYGYNSCGTTLLPKGSVVISSRAPIGKINITGDVLCTNQGCKSLVSETDNRYLYYLLLAGQEELVRLGRGTTFIELSTYDLANFGIVLPQETEQCAIADFLDAQCAKIDSVIADIEKQIETLHKYKKSLITEAVTKGLDRSVPMKNSEIKNIDDIPQGWSVQRLKYVSRLKTGTTPAGNEGINYEGQGIPWFTPSDFVPSLELEKSEKFVDDETVNREGITPYPANSILLVAIGATVGKIGITKSKGYSNQQITAIIPTGIDSKYLLYYLFSKADYIKDNALYTTLPIINNAYLSNIPVIIPSEQEQKDIAQYLDRRCSLISKIICDKEKQLKTVQQHKKSLIYEYVTGKKRVTEVN